MARRVGIRAILVDERFELLALAQRGGVDAEIMLAAFGEILQIGIHIAGKHRELSPRKFERVRAGSFQERPIVRHHQTTGRKVAQKLLEQHLGAQVEEVRRLVEDQQVRIVQQ